VYTIQYIIVKKW